MIWRLLYWLGIARNRASGGAHLAPHQQFPEIMHWERGDRFRLPHSDWYQLISVNESGYAYVTDVISGHKDKVHIARLVGHNDSLLDREIDEEIKQTGAYMQLIDEFNAAYAELKERDKKLKLVS